MRPPESDDLLDECIFVGNSGDLDEDIQESEDQPDSQGLDTLAQEVTNLMEQGITEPLLDEFAKLHFQPYPTPPQSPPAALLAASIQGPEDSESKEIFSSEGGRPGPQVWKAAFSAGRLSRRVGNLNGESLDRIQFQRLLRSPKGMKAIHRRNLPPPPTSHRDIKDHPLGCLFEQAEKDHLQSHVPMNSWTITNRSEARGEQILDCMWVYVYKFDKHGRLLKCKARLVVRGDQQAKGVGDTYAATLAARSFRTFMAIAARFDLELKQYDAVNAFVHAPLQKKVFMRMPMGYRQSGKVFCLNKALYGLRESPKLWQQMLTGTLIDIGFKPIPHEPCCLTLDGILIFFYVDDIVLAYRKPQRDKAKDLINRLKGQYNISGGEDLQWFLGIAVYRDRRQKRAWLSQASYIEKIVKLADTSPSNETPMLKAELLPYQERASGKAVRSYQKKIGSLLYAAVTTRVDIAFAVSRLARFLTNPSPEHHAAADRVLHYLYRHRTLGLQLGGADDFLVATDASFADNSLDRKSSQAYVMVLFGGVIGWRANKQSTVTTSTTEAELLALSQGAKEGQYIKRLLDELEVSLDSQRIRIHCDNRQTIRLVTEEITRLQTKLRHVDIHNHWLRQEVRDGRITVEHVPTKQMIANGLTKALSKGEFHEFLKQVNLVDIANQIADREAKENQQEELDHNSVQAYMGDFD